MSVEERLRSALRDQAEAFVPPVETALDRVRARGGRWRAVTIALAASAAAAVAVVGVWAVAEMTGEDAIPTTVPTAPASPTGAAEDDGSPLRGSIRADVAEPAALAGAWTLTLNGNGTMDVTPPPGFAGDVSGALFTADRTSFRSTLFGSDLCSGDGTGIYDWLRVGDRIEFHVLSDACDARSRYFADSSWSVSTAPGAGD